jgi:hypothetical protein
VHFEMKFYHNQRNAQTFHLFPYLLLPYMFRAFFKPIFKKHCLLGVMSASGPGGTDADTLPRRLEPLPNLYPVPLEDGLKERPKQVRQK